MKTYDKYAVEKRRLYVDYSCFLEDAEVLNAFQAQISPLTSPSLTITLAYADATNKKLTMMVSGGIGNKNYVIQLITQTSQGQLKREDIGMRVLP